MYSSMSNVTPTAGNLAKAARDSSRKLAAGFNVAQLTNENPPVPLLVSVAVAEEYILHDKAVSVCSMAIMDVLVHVSFWILALVTEVMAFDKTDKWRKLADGSTANHYGINSYPYVLASTILTYVGFGVLFFVILYHLCNRGKINSQVDAVIVSLITGSVLASTVMSFIVVAFSGGVIDHSNDEWRSTTLLLLLTKVFLYNILTNNLRQVGSYADWEILKKVLSGKSASALSV